jgi:phosphomannomutase
VDAIAARYSRSVVRPGRSRRALAQAVLDGRAVFAGSTLGGFIFGDFFPAYDGVLTVGMLTGMLNRLETTLDEVVEGLPEFHKAEISVFCPAARKGAVMRLVTDRASSMKAQLTEGVRVVYEDGWALVLPGSSEPSVTVWSEGPDSASAVGRAEEWAEVVRKAIAETD